MKPSYYNVFFPFNGNFILFNTLRGSIFVVDSEIKECLEKNETSTLGDYESAFKSNGILVEDTLNEQDEIKIMYERSKYNTTSTTLHVITSYACNLACIYCYEGKGDVECKSMDEKTTQCAIKFIKDLTETNNSKSLGIELFGGEPLLNMPMNLLVAEELSTWCEDNGTYFSVNAITNGTLSTEKNVEDLSQYHCSFLVTLDGPQEIHDKRRIYKDGKGTFNDIIEGLHRVRDHKLGIMIRINADRTNKAHIVPLFEFLKDEGFANVTISIKPVFNTSPACLSYSYCMPDLEGLKVINELYVTARKLNFRTEEPEKPSPQGACSAQRISYYTIDPHLRLFKCAILPPFEKNSVGSVNIETGHPEFNPTHVDFLSRDVLFPDECRPCQLLPICRGGCPAEIYETQGTTHGNMCKKSGFYDTLKEDLVNFVKKQM